MGQHSVFLVPSEYLEGLEGLEDETWLNAGLRILADPDNGEAHWITVILPREMDDTHSDEDIIKYVFHSIRIRRAIVSEVAHHNLGMICISIPVPISTANTTTVLARAEIDVNKWLELIRDGFVTLDRGVIFGRR
ncbi:hypothetical protein N7491_007378 [Penicillium cf. griseofulvum]|uniref:Uncharacterized protein n=1 Tax=Penicillium cf. griseofulvum TaxID=2972120 RepID=A0A9W9ITD0_9EURO|nr:hypothetical protein N7472_009593 [Penicillium cf. griseofulvum]KAJ5430362.1 hypothetical protein N7491_007378 [Penicillium cf. griseofulvum]KAJ5435868.1 hypothetical protein N7445_006753 [Penicillium cf. griseofulvum]